MKKGFTLIELLAVIVILAIIALIATPIVLNIINSTKESSTLRSAEMYVKSAEISIAQSTLKNQNITDGTYNLKDGNICLNTDCTEKLDVEVDGEAPTSGTITVTEGSISQVKLNYKDSKTIVKNSAGNLVYDTSICQIVSGSEKVVGSKYECEVKPGSKYNFYVLSYNQDGTTNLIMDQNIYSDGTPAGLNLVTKEDNPQKYSVFDTCYGTTPIKTEFLYHATKDWVNVLPINYEYIITTNEHFEGDLSFISIDGIAEIKQGDTYDYETGEENIEIVTLGTQKEPLRTRMADYSVEINGLYVGEIPDDIKEKYPFLFENVNDNVGYSLMSSLSETAYEEMQVLGDQLNLHGARIGVRPVIKRRPKINWSFFVKKPI